MHASRILRARGAICAAVLISIAAFTAASAARAADHGAPQDMAAPGAMAGGHGGGHGSAPAGVMGAHMVPAGAMMVSYSPMFMHMEGNKIGTTDVSPETIATLPNRFSPPHAKFLRIVPTAMDMQMHMLGAMFGLSDSLKLMVKG